MTSLERRALRRREKGWDSSFAVPAAGDDLGHPNKGMHVQAAPLMTDTDLLELHNQWVAPSVPQNKASSGEYGRALVTFSGAAAAADDGVESSDTSSDEFEDAARSFPPQFELRLRLLR